MKIGIYLEGSPALGGGFFQSLKASLLLPKTISLIYISFP